MSDMKIQISTYGRASHEIQEKYRKLGLSTYWTHKESVEIHGSWKTEVELDAVLAALIEDYRRYSWKQVEFIALHRYILLCSGSPDYYEEEWHETGTSQKRLHRLTGPVVQHGTIGKPFEKWWAVHGHRVAPFDGLLRGDGIEEYVCKEEKAGIVIGALSKAGLIAVDPMLLENLLMA